MDPKTSGKGKTFMEIRLKCILSGGIFRSQAHWLWSFLLKFHIIFYTVCLKPDPQLPAKPSQSIGFKARTTTHSTSSSSPLRGSPSFSSSSLKTSPTTAYSPFSTSTPVPLPPSSCFPQEHYEP